MCSTVLWTINRAAFTPEFREWTLKRIGTEPQMSALRIEDNSLVSKTATAFTLTGQFAVVSCSGS